MNDAVRDSLENIQASIILIQRRFIDIQTADQLLSDTDDLLTLDAVAMRLQIVGENEKSLASLAPELLQRYPEIEWDKIMRLRDIISHHYDVLDHEIIFNACKENIPELHRVIELMAKSDSTD
jgi:uncharacterized protein with HEPN domain